MVDIKSKGSRFKDKKGAKIFVRCNDNIRSPEVRLIDQNGEMIGVVPIADAKFAARQVGLDLIEISPNATPPVCRILDFGKYQYEVTKKQKIAKSPSAKIKEVKFRFCTESHDYMTKLRHIIEFLTGGSKVKASVFFKGRELNQTQLGFDLIKKLTEDLKEYASLDAESKLVGRNIVATYSPVKNLKQKQQSSAHISSTEINKNEGLKNTVLS